MPGLSPSGCLGRIARFRDLMRRRGIDAVAISDLRDIYYFTGQLGPPCLPALLLLESEGRAWLFSPHKPADATVDECVEYSWHEQGTFHADFLARLGGVAHRALSGAVHAKRLGWQAESLPRHLAEVLDGALHPDDWQPIDCPLLEMQRHKDADEVSAIRDAVRTNLAAYDAVQKDIRPGASELDVLAAGAAGAMLAAGEPVFHDGDYRCGRLNGLARDRRIERGELYIVDAWTCHRGYWSDLSRTFIVGGEPTELQQSLFDHVVAVQRGAAALLRPGADGRDIWRQLDKHLREHPVLADSGLVHHGGHAIGLRAHELPDVNRDRGGLLEPGMVICIEPGGYTNAARYGVRLENMYLITESGCENLSDYPMELTPRT